MKYKVYECEEFVTKKGKPYKKAVLKDADREDAHPEPRVAIWDNFPGFADIKAGGVVEGFIKKEDSGTPIPAHPEKNYINRSLVEHEQNPNGTQAVTGDVFLEARVAKLEAKVFGEAKEDVDYPTEDGINPDDIPF